MKLVLMLMLKESMEMQRERERGRDCRPVGRDVDRVVEVESVESGS